MMKLYVEGYDLGKHEHLDALGEEWETAHYVYADGILEDMAHYDIVGYSCYDNFDFKTDRTENVIAVLPSGEEVDAVLFFWHELPELCNDIKYIVSCYRTMKDDPVYLCHGRVVAKKEKENILRWQKRMAEIRKENNKRLSKMHAALKVYGTTLCDLI